MEATLIDWIIYAQIHPNSIVTKPWEEVNLLSKEGERLHLIEEEEEMDALQIKFTEDHQNSLIIHVKTDKLPNNLFKHGSRTLK